MKKIAKLFVAAALMFTVVGCSNGNSDAGANVDLAELSAELLEKGANMEIDMPGLVDVSDEMWEQMDGLTTEERLMEWYGIDAADVEQYAVLKNPMSFGIYEVAMFEVKDGKMDTIKAAVEAQIAVLEGNAFYPEDQEMVKNREVYENGNYYFFAVGGTATETMDFLKTAFN
ncbi:MAG: DUF4358 domain-containing protein [Erysipelotrichaceae bacterium]